MGSPCSKLPFNNQPPTGTPANLMYRTYSAESCIWLGLWPNIAGTQNDLKVCWPGGGSFEISKLAYLQAQLAQRKYKSPKDNGRLSLTGTLRMKPIITSLKENNSKWNKHLDKLGKGICTCEIEVKEEPLGNSKFCPCYSEARPTNNPPGKQHPLHLSHHSHFTPQFFLPFLLFLNFLMSTSLNAPDLPPP